MDAAHRTTDEELLRIEKRLTEIYNQAAQELQEKADKYFERFKVLDAQKRVLVDAGKMSEADYKKWRQGKVMSGKHWTEMRRQAAQRLTDADKTAAEYVNGRLPHVYSLNYNKVAEALETRLAGYSFEMVSEETVRHLAIADRKLLPARRVDVAKDMRWNMQMFQAETLQGILQGESMDKIAKRIFPEIMKKADKKGKTEAEMKGVTKRARDAAIRNARTMVTGAENKGRIDMLHDARKKGVIANKIWMAAHDSRTREAHAELDGEETEEEEYFENSVGKILYPGDPDAAPANTYNCRCSLGYKVVGFGNQKAESADEEYFGDKHKKEREIYGVEDSMSYETSQNGEVDVKYYERVQENGKWVTKRGVDSTVKVSNNPSETEILVQTVKKPSGFMRTDDTRNTILTNGRIAVNYDTGNNLTRTRVRSMIENEIDILGGVRKNGVFYRVTDNSKDQKYILSGKIRPSVNHMTGQKEDGLSVWERPKYYGTYLEKLSGEVIGIGSDGEPLLDVKTIELISVNEDNIVKMRELGKRRFLEVYGWTEEQLKKALEGRYKIMR